MEGDDGPDYGHVSPTGEATSVLASVGEPQFENASGVGNRDDAGLRGSGEGEQDRSPEEVARDLFLVVDCPNFKLFLGRWVLSCDVVSTSSTWKQEAATASCATGGGGRDGPEIRPGHPQPHGLRHARYLICGLALKIRIKTRSLSNSGHQLSFWLQKTSCEGQGFSLNHTCKIFGSGRCMEDDMR